MVQRLNKTADMVDATRRILVCRVAAPIRNQSLLIAGCQAWLNELLA
jgi:hypothetical protein